MNRSHEGINLSITTNERFDRKTDSRIPNPRNIEAQDSDPLTLHGGHAGHGGHATHTAHVHPGRRHELARHPRHGRHLVVVAGHRGGEVAHAHPHPPSSVQP